MVSVAFMAHETRKYCNATTSIDTASASACGSRAATAAGAEADTKASFVALSRFACHLKLRLSWLHMLSAMQAIAEKKRRAVSEWAIGRLKSPKCSTDGSRPIIATSR